MQVIPAKPLALIGPSLPIVLVWDRASEEALQLQVYRIPQWHEWEDRALPAFVRRHELESDIGCSEANQGEKGQGGPVPTLTDLRDRPSLN
jgi:hypothetical protein